MSSSWQIYYEDLGYFHALNVYLHPSYFKTLNLFCFGYVNVYISQVSCPPIQLTLCAIPCKNLELNSLGISSKYQELFPNLQSPTTLIHLEVLPFQQRQQQQQQQELKTLTLAPILATNTKTNSTLPSTTTEEIHRCLAGRILQNSSVFPFNTSHGELILIQIVGYNDEITSNSNSSSSSPPPPSLYTITKQTKITLTESISKLRIPAKFQESTFQLSSLSISSSSSSSLPASSSSSLSSVPVDNSDFTNMRQSSMLYNEIWDFVIETLNITPAIKHQDSMHSFTLTPPSRVGLLCGPSGVGKTHLIQEILVQFNQIRSQHQPTQDMEDSKQSSFTPLPQISYISALSLSDPAAAQSVSSSKNPTMEQVCLQAQKDGIGVLVIDDLDSALCKPLDSVGSENEQALNPTGAAFLNFLDQLHSSPPLYFSDPSSLDHIRTSVGCSHNPPMVVIAIVRENHLKKAFSRAGRIDRVFTLRSPPASLRYQILSQLFQKSLPFHFSDPTNPKRITYVEHISENNLAGKFCLKLSEITPGYVPQTLKKLLKQILLLSWQDYFLKFSTFAGKTPNLVSDPSVDDTEMSLSTADESLISPVLLVVTWKHCLKALSLTKPLESDLNLTITSSPSSSSSSSFSSVDNPNSPNNPEDATPWRLIGGYTKQIKSIKLILNQWLNDHELSNISRQNEKKDSTRGNRTGLGIKPPSGLLFTGPSGCGKTMVATALAQASGLNILTLNASDLFCQYLGESEAKLRSVFALARQISPSVIFLDQLEALAAKRDANSADSTGVSGRILTTLLTEMDGVSQRQGVYVLGAVVDSSSLDDALIRPGRFDQVIHLSKPSFEDRLAILRIHSASLTLGPDVDLAHLAALTGSDRSSNITTVGLENHINNVGSENLQTNANDHEIDDKSHQDISQTSGCFDGASLTQLCRAAGLRALTMDITAPYVCMKDFLDVLETEFKVMVSVPVSTQSTTRVRVGVT